MSIASSSLPVKTTISSLPSASKKELKEIRSKSSVLKNDRLRNVVTSKSLKAAGLSLSIGILSILGYRLGFHKRCVPFLQQLKSRFSPLPPVLLPVQEETKSGFWKRFKPYGIGASISGTAAPPLSWLYGRYRHEVGYQRDVEEWNQLLHDYEDLQNFVKTTAEKIRQRRRDRENQSNF